MTEENKSLELIHEIIVDIVINGSTCGSVSCTPQDLECLAAGWLLTEEHIHSARQINKIDVHLEDRRLDVGILVDADAPGISGSRAGKTDQIEWTREDLRNMSRQFAVEPPLWKTTRAAHSCMIVRHVAGAGTLEFLYRCEDAGRHTALDKAIGWALLHEIDLSESLLYTSGRISTRMALKAAAAGVGAMTGRGRATHEAVEIARENQMLLVANLQSGEGIWYESI